MRSIGCFLLLMCAAFLAGEVWFAWTYVAEWIAPPGNPDPLTALIGMALLTIAGVVTVRKRLAGFMPAVMSGQGGRAAVGIVGGLLLALPGYITGVLGLVLLLPPVQTVAGRVMASIMAVMVRRFAGKMPGMPGGANPFAGAANPFGAGGANPFGAGQNPFAGAGGKGNPFQQAGFKPDAKQRSGKVVDVDAERVD